MVELNDTEIRVATDQITIRGAVMVGCPLPATEFFATFLAEEIFTFITEFGYESLTLEEILLALRLNCKGGLKLPTGAEIEIVQFFGSTFNVDFLSKVLHNYMSLRNLLDRKLENLIDGY